ncbi:MAG: hypothetical protein ACRYGI_11330 [Janthinobacterium lividum]
MRESQTCPQSAADTVVVVLQPLKTGDRITVPSGRPVAVGESYEPTVFGTVPGAARLELMTETGSGHYTGSEIHRSGDNEFVAWQISALI